MNDLDAAAWVLHNDSRLRCERDDDAAALDVAPVQRVCSKRVDVLSGRGDRERERAASAVSEWKAWAALVHGNHTTERCRR